MKLTRRSFLKVVGATGAVAAAVKFADRTILQALGPQSPHKASAQEKWVPSVCFQCPAGCGIRVRVVNGNAVKIEGNPLHPINEGLLCPKGQSGLQILYDPDRIKGPMKRTNPRKGPGEDPRFVRVTWDEALDDIAARLRRLREEGK